MRPQIVEFTQPVFPSFLRVIEPGQRSDEVVRLYRNNEATFYPLDSEKLPSRENVARDGEDEAEIRIFFFHFAKRKGLDRRLAAGERRVFERAEKMAHRGEQREAENSIQISYGRSRGDKEGRRDRGIRSISLVREFRFCTLPTRGLITTRRGYNQLY